MCKEENEAYDPHARPGMILETGLGRLYDARRKTGGSGTSADKGWQEGEPPRGPIEFLPVHRDFAYVEREPYPGKFIGVRQPNDELVLRLLQEQGRFGKLRTTDGHEIFATFLLSVLYAASPLTETNPRRALVPFSITKNKVFQQIFDQSLGIRYGVKAPSFWAHRWYLWSAYEKNDSGEFWNYRTAIIDPRALHGALPNTAVLGRNHPLYIMGKEFHDQIAGGAVKPDYEAATETDKLDDAIPF
jgi:hypothetical protein